MDFDTSRSCRGVVHLKWIPVYTVSFSLNGGSGTTPADISNVLQGSVLNESQKPSNSFTRTGYTNDGKWYTSANGGNEFVFGTSTVTQNITLYLKWTPIIYTITYNLDGGVNNASNPDTYTIEDDSITFESPTKNSYSFDGWYTVSSFTGSPVTTISTGSTENREYWARWVVPYNIIYHLYDGIQNAQNPTMYYAESAWTLYNPTKTGYTFSGWFDNADFTGTALTSISLGNTGDKELYAKWTTIAYYITYNLNSGTNSSDNPTTYTITSTVTLQEPTRIGYTFSGWYASSSFSGLPVTLITEGSTGNVTLYARWTVISYDITYHLDGGIQNASNPETYTIAGSVTLYNPTKSGYTLDGWYDNEDFTGTALVSIPPGSTGDKDLYAKWTAIVYDITYNLNSGTNSSENPAAYTIENAITLHDPTRTGYTFDGWYATSSFTEDPITSIPSGSTEDKDFYAKWTVINYDITYYLNGGTQNVLNPDKYTINDINVDIFSEDFNRSDWTAANSGWELSNFGRNTTSGVGGSAGLRVNLYIYRISAVAQTPIVILGNEPTFSFSYKVTNYSGGAATPASSFSMNVQISTNGGSIWNTISTISHTASTAYQTLQVSLADYANQSCMVRISAYYSNGDFNVDIDDVSISSSASITIQSPNKAGYTFDGWYDNEDFTGTALVSIIPSGSIGNKNLYAKWTLNTYTVTFIDHDGIVLKTEYVEHGSNATDPVAPEREGYIFDGWDIEFDEVTDHLTVTATYKDDPTQIQQQIAIGQISVKAINGGILLENLPSNTKVELYNLQGKQIYLGNSGNSKILQILIQTKGVYIVKTGKTKQHIVVK